MTAGPDRDLHGSSADEAPPFLGRWNRVYAAVLAYLAALIALFYIFPEIFS